MRPCPACGHRSDPTVSSHCPECGEAQLPVGWTVLFREATPQVWWAAHIGSLIFLGILADWVLSMFTGGKHPNIGAFAYLGMISLPVSIARLSGKRLDDVWIITDTRLEHRPRIGSTTFHAADDGWDLASVKPPRKGHLWTIRLKRTVNGRKKGQVDVQVDARQNDPAQVESIIRRVLTPASTSGT